MKFLISIQSEKIKRKLIKVTSYKKSKEIYLPHIEKLLEIDLGTGKTKSKAIEKEIASKYIGGRGIGVKLLYDMLSPNIDPLSCENVLIFATGPLTGSVVPLSGRHVVVSKSPLTGTIFDSSAGGFFGRELRRSGFDVVIIKGASEKPVYIEIDDGNIDIKDAKNIWGKNVKESTTALSSEGFKVSCIGKAGEKLIPMSSIMSEYSHACGRGGLGAVMGSKKLKAIIVRGSRSIEISDNEKMEKYIAEAMRLLKASPVASKGLAYYGTPSLVNLINAMRIMPTDNFRKIHFENAYKVSGEYIAENYDLKKKTCYNCFIACKREDRKRGIEIPEYETIAMFGPNSMNDDIEKIIQANAICNDYGIDTISAGNAVSCYIELEGKKEIEVPLKEIVEGGPLSKGSYRYSKEKGKEHCSMSVKGLEIPGYDPRGVLGLALSYATSNRGACHLRAYMVGPEILGKPKLIDRLSFSGKSGLIQIFQNISAGVHSLVMCQFSSFALSEEEYSNLLSAGVGQTYSSEDFIKTGERIYNLERLFNIRENTSYSKDTLPERFFGDGGISKKDFDSVLEEYYTYRGWNNGVPTKEKIESLELKKEGKFLVERDS